MLSSAHYLGEHLLSHIRAQCSPALADVDSGIRPTCWPKFRGLPAPGGRSSPIFAQDIGDGEGTEHKPHIMHMVSTVVHRGIMSLRVSIGSRSTLDIWRTLRFTNARMPMYASAPCSLIRADHFTTIVKTVNHSDCIALPYL